MSGRDAAGWAITLDGGGLLRAVLHDAAGVLGPMMTGAAFPSMVTSSTRDSAFAILEDCLRDGVSTDRLVRLPSRPAIRMSVVAISGEGGLLVVGGDAGRALELLDALSRVNNDQATLLRAALKKQSTPRPPDESLLEDMTRLNNELAATQRSLVRANAELRRLDRDKNRLLGMAAHDLRNPLGTLRGYAEFLQDTFELDPDVAELVGWMHESADEMLLLVNELLDVSMIESGELRLQPQRLDFSELARREVEKERVRATRKQIRLLTELPDEVWVDVDAAKMRQVVANLLGNAVKYSFERTTVTIRLKAEDTCAHLSVTDQGQGIPEAELGKLFKPFGKTSVRTTAGEPSTGLGLAICKRIVEGHDGRISVTSEVGKGSTFLVKVPLPG